ncbi:unnamed protein product [Closterium sp. Naga37s-1]|nr:unnamed protein product [Closterium sp. Naga37s-1]
MVTPCIGALCPQAGPNAAANGPAYNEAAVNESGEPAAEHGTDDLRACEHKRAQTRADGGNERMQAHQLVASTKCTCGHELVRGCKVAAGTQSVEGEGAQGEGAKGGSCGGCGVQADVLAELLGGGLGKLSAGEVGEAGTKREREIAGRGGEGDGKGESEKGRGMGNAVSLACGIGGGGIVPGVGGKGNVVGKDEERLGEDGRGGGIFAAVAAPLVAAAAAAVAVKPAAAATAVSATTAGAGAAAGAAAAGSEPMVTAGVGEESIEGLWHGWDGEGQGGGEGKRSEEGKGGGEKKGGAEGKGGGEGNGGAEGMGGGVHERVDSPRGDVKRREVRWKGRGVGVGGTSSASRVRGGEASEGRSVGVNLYERATAADFVNRKQIGSGRNAVVYAASCAITGRKVAVKAYVKSALSALDRHRINREVALLMTLNHEHIIQWLGHFEDAQCVYIVQEWASGGDLFEELRASGGHMGEARIAKHILLPLIAALHHMHTRGVMHRDLKPENLLLTFHGTLKVCDFGLAINMKEERPASRLGTLQYMAPEVVQMARGQRGRGGQGRRGKGEEKRGGAEIPKGTAAAGQGQVVGGAGAVSGMEGKNGASPMLEGAYDEKVDIWACGVLVYELVMGHPPFEGTSDMHTATNIMHRELVPDALPHGMSPACKDFICKGTAGGGRFIRRITTSITPSHSDDLPA